MAHSKGLACLGGRVVVLGFVDEVKTSRVRASVALHRAAGVVSHMNCATRKIHRKGVESTPSDRSCEEGNLQLWITKFGSVGWEIWLGEK